MRISDKSVWRHVSALVIGTAAMWVGLVVSQGVGSATEGLGFAHGVTRIFGRPSLVLFVSLYSLAWAISILAVLQRLRNRRS